MNFNEYQIKARATAVYPNLGNNYIYPCLGLCGESGEVSEKIKKIIRDDKGIITPEKRMELIRELGDVMWYVANLAFELNAELDFVATTNIEKLKKRKEENKLHGNGDNR